MLKQLVRATEVASDPDAPSDMLGDSAVVADATDETLVMESQSHSSDDEIASVDDEVDVEVGDCIQIIAESTDSPIPPLADDEAYDSNRTDADEDLDKLLDGAGRTLENFLSELETRLLNGQSIIRNRIWAKKNFKIDAKSFARYLDIIRGTWNLEGTSLFVMQTRRNEYRAMYRDIALEARSGAKRDDGTVDAKALAVSLKALDSMAQLDGMTSPEVSIQINQMLSQNGHDMSKAELTNKVRERTQILLQTMRDRSVQHAAIATRAIADAQNGPRNNARVHERDAAGTAEDPLVVPSSQVMGAVK